MRVTELVAGKQPAPPAVPEKLYNEIVILIDDSGSMVDLAEKAVQSLNGYINTIKQAAFDNREAQSTCVSIYAFDNTLKPLRVHAHPESIAPITTRELRLHQGTALLWAYNQARVKAREEVDSLTRKPFHHGRKPSSDVAYLFVTITDGGENASGIVERTRFVEFMRKETENTTNVFIVPPRMRPTMASWGAALGNILEWEQTESGVEESYAAASSGTQSFYGGRAVGVRSTSAFFTDLSKVTQKDLDKLDDLSGAFKKWSIEQEDNISDFVRKKNKGVYAIGNAYYQLTKSEKIADHKKILIAKKGAKEIYGGEQARKLLGISSGPGVTVRVKPGNHAGFDIFINSTSTNRKLVRGTTLLYEK